MNKKTSDNKLKKEAKKTTAKHDIPAYPDDARELLGKFTANYINISDGFNSAATNKPQKA